MVEAGRGDGVHKSNPKQDKELRPANGACGTPRFMPKEVRAGGEAREETEAPIILDFKGNITLRRMSIKPDKKRREYVRRLEDIVELCEEALSDPNSIEGTQLKAANVIINAIRMSYNIVREVDIENLERHTKEIQKILEKRARES
jgi:hypothetical protein